MPKLPIELSFSMLWGDKKLTVGSIDKPSVSVPEEEAEEVRNRLLMAASDDGEIYEQNFVRIFCLIKLNSLLSPECNINKELVEGLAQIYNKKEPLQIRKAKSDEQFFAQVILEGKLHRFLKLDSVKNILSGQCLLATSLAVMLRKSREFMQKAEITFALSFLALSGRYQAFISNVHQEKNHKGQINFAKTIFEYIKIDSDVKHSKIEVESRRVQDPYSMRCASQAYGVVYDCIQNLSHSLHQTLNKFHFKTLKVKGKDFANLDLLSDQAVLKADYLVCSMNEVGSMSFLRSERILNNYLGKNELHKHSPRQVLELKALMERTIHCLSDNKVIATPSNIDTMNLDNYEKDVFFTSCKPIEKFEQMLHNLYRIMHLEILTAIQGLENVYHINEGEIFKNKTIREQYLRLRGSLSPSTRKQNLFFIEEKWTIAQPYDS